MNDNREFEVFGIPKPGGSKKAFYNKKTGRAIVVDDCKQNKEWRNTVLDAYMEHFGSLPPLEGPLHLKINFFLPRPKGHFTKSGVLTKSAPVFPITKPDTTKLIRSTEDALTKFAWRDDSQVVFQTVQKYYDDLRKPGAIIAIWILSEMSRT